MLIQLVQLYYKFVLNSGRIKRQNDCVCHILGGKYSLIERQEFLIK